MSDPIVRVAQRADIEKIIAFNASMALETEGLALDIKRLREGVKAVFADSQKGFYLVVEQDHDVRACLMITTEWSDWRNGLFWWIQSVFVEKQYRKQGLYKSMYTHLKRKLVSEPNVAGIRLYVEKDNVVAQKTYQKLGMHKTDYQLYEYSKIKIN